MGQADNPWTVLGLERTSDMQATFALPVAYTLSRVVTRKADTWGYVAGGEAPVA